MLDLNNSFEKKTLPILSLIQRTFKKLNKHEELTLNFSGEESLFLRFNSGKARQVTSVNQGILNLNFVENSRSLNYRIQISGVDEVDSSRIDLALKFCREKVKSLPEDPFIVAIENNGVTNEHFKGKLPCIENVSKNLLLFHKE